jgi:hypothetical protein
MVMIMPMTNTTKLPPINNHFMVVKTPANQSIISV